MNASDARGNRSGHYAHRARYAAAQAAAADLVTVSAYRAVKGSPAPMAALRA